MQVTQWKEPALTWNGAVPEEGPASILEIRSDQFIPDFLQAMGSNDPAVYFDEHRIDDNGSPGSDLQLFQPLHGCYYLVTASLVCRQLGLPDKNVDRSTGESAFYVIRRLTESGEEAWIPRESGGYWQPLGRESALTLALGEERLPMHPVKICPQPETPQSVFTDNVERDLYYGYIPTGNRDKYKDTVGRTTSSGTSASTLVNDFIDEAETASGEEYSFRQGVFLRRVYLPWKSLLSNLSVNGDGNVVLRAEFGTDAQTEQLYALLELGDFLKNNLPTLWSALEADDASSLPEKMSDLFEALTNEMELKSNDSDHFLGDLLLAYEEHFNLVRGDGAFPETDFDFRDFDLGDLDSLYSDVQTALPAETEPIQLPDGEHSPLARLITDQVQPRPQSEPRYHIRTVYEYDPACPPVVSPVPTRPFRLAKFFEPDAPARLVRLEAPSIKPRDLRRYAQGVGIEMSPELHKLTSCLGGDEMQDVVDSAEDCEDGGLSIQMICTFSIQIIFLVAFIVMFIFLIALNFIFGWLAYLRICLPIPSKD